MLDSEGKMQLLFDSATFQPSQYQKTLESILTLTPRASSTEIIGSIFGSAEIKNSDHVIAIFEGTNFDTYANTMYIEMVNPVRLGNQLITRAKEIDLIVNNDNCEQWMHGPSVLSEKIPLSCTDVDSSGSVENFAKTFGQKIEAAMQAD